jgi:hypothetical protein
MNASMLAISQRACLPLPSSIGCRYALTAGPNGTAPVRAVFAAAAAATGLGQPFLFIALDDPRRSRRFNAAQGSATRAGANDDRRRPHLFDRSLRSFFAALAMRRADFADAVRRIRDRRLQLIAALVSGDEIGISFAHRRALRAPRMNRHRPAAETAPERKRYNLNTLTSMTMGLLTKLGFLSVRRVRRAQRATRVFVSYTGRHPADEELAKRIHDALRARAVSVFVAPLSIEPGSEWRSALRKELAECSHFVVVVSEASMRSEEVISEIRFICERRRDQVRVVPILYGRLSANSFADIQGIPFRNYSAFAPIEISSRDEVRHVCDRLLKLLGVATPGAARGALHGRVVPLLCDREEQEDAIDALLAHPSPAEPCAFFIGGREEDNGDSFVERIVITKLTPGGLAARPAQIRIPWHGGWSRHSGPRALTALLFEKLALPTGDISAAAFARHASALPDPVIVLTHTLYGDEWSITETPKILSAYLNFWDKVSSSGATARFVLFFLIIYPPDGDTPAPSPAAIRASLSSTIARRRVRATLVRDLPCVREKHVHRWFADYAGDIPEPERMQKIAALFATSTCQHMEAVEAALRRIQADYMETS